MRYIFFILAAICITAVACKKDKEKPTPPLPDAPELVQFRLRLAGEFLTSDAPLPGGRKFRDSTLYSLIVYRAATPHVAYAGGMFDHAGDITLELPVEQKFNISVRAFRKGTGGGLFYTWQNGLPYFDYPTNAPLKNIVDTAYRNMEDTVSWLKVTDPADSTKYFGEKESPELDVFRGTASINVTPDPVSLTINMKRLSFGVQLASPNFTEGKLILEIPGTHTKTVTPVDISSRHFIFATDLFKFMEEFDRTVKVKWQKPDGTIVPQGEKTIRFKRNVLTTIQVKLSADGRTNLNPIITETDWKGSETVDF